MDAKRGNPRLMAIPELLGKNFFIPDYQRGFRWEKRQILQLIEDIYNYFSDEKIKEEFYCLQPIVVKECQQETIKEYKLDSKLDDGRWYEVIDGQQRLTAIRILLAIYFQGTPFDDRKPYKLEYATRPTLGSLFETLKFNFRDKSFSFGCEQELPSCLTKKKTMDRTYIENCINDILECFNHDERSKPGEEFHLQFTAINTFLENLLKSENEKKSVRVLWYETTEDCDARDIFERVNDLKIPLSNSELIRALFLSSTSEYIYENDNVDLSPTVKEELKRFDAEKKRLHIKSRWDEIEHRLRNDELWAFITNRSGDDARNRIEILFDLISRKYDNEDENASGLNKDDDLYTFLYFDWILKSGAMDLWKLWKEKVEAYYDRLCYWFEDNDSYHRIGYLIFRPLIFQHDKRTDAMLTQLLAEATNKGHEEFDDFVVSKIKERLPAKDKIKSLDYRTTYKDIMSLLVLYNIETYRRISAIAGRFPFVKFKEMQKKPGWTIEHIHAQDSECLDQNKKDEWASWAKVNSAALKNSKLLKINDKKLVDDLDMAVKRIEAKDEKFTHNDIVALFERVSKVYEDGPMPAVHTLGNLSLLDGGVNAGIGKSAFEVKRQYLLKVDADGGFIPYCTRKVFFKQYYPEDSEDQQLLSPVLYSWSDDDRKAYLADMAKVLSPYYPEAIFKEEV